MAWLNRSLELDDRQIDFEVKILMGLGVFQIVSRLKTGCCLD